MADVAPFLFVATMDVDPEHADLFDAVYDKEHLPYLREVPGVRSASRFVAVPFEVSIGGQVVTKDASWLPRNVAIYELDALDVLTSRPWSRAVERGRWPTQVRPLTRDRRHAVLKRA